MNNPTPLHPVATTQAGELPKLPPHPEHNMVWTDREQAAIRAYALSAIEMQASHSAAQWVCTQCGKDCANPFADDICACGNDAFRLRDRAHPSPTTAPAAKGNVLNRDWPEDFGQENGNYENTCRDCSMCFMGNKHRRVCKACATAPAATTPAASESATHTIIELTGHTINVDFATTEAKYRVEIVKALNEAGAPITTKDGQLMNPPDQIRWLAAQVAANKPAEVLTEDQMAHVLKCRSMRDVATRAYNLGLQSKPADIEPVWNGESTIRLTDTEAELMHTINQISEQQVSKPAAASGEINALRSPAFTADDGRPAPQHQVQAGGDAELLKLGAEYKLIKEARAKRGANTTLGTPCCCEFAEDGETLLTCCASHAAWKATGSPERAAKPVDVKNSVLCCINRCVSGGVSMGWISDAEKAKIADFLTSPPAPATVLPAKEVAGLPEHALDAAIEAYDANWSPTNLGRAQKEEAIGAAYFAIIAALKEPKHG